MKRLVQAAARLRPLVRRASAHRHELVLVALLALLTGRYIFQEPAENAVASPYAQGDGVYYYAYLRSLLFDGDVDFSNDYAALGNPFEYPNDPTTGLPRNVTTLGAALFWSPFALLGLLIGPDTVAPVVPGTMPGFQRIVFYGSVFWGWMAMVLCYASARRLFPRTAALIGATTTFLASPLPWYMLRQPSYSHAASACAATLILFLTMRYRERPSWTRWALAGASVGLAALVRPQNAIFATFPFAIWLLEAIDGIRGGTGPRFRAIGMTAARAGVALGAAFLMFLPQCLAWKTILGSYVIVPQGSSFMLWGSSRIGAVLFSGNAGLFSWHPLLYVGALSLIAMLFRPPLRIWGTLGLLSLALQAYVNGAAYDWWGGWAFGGRRFAAVIGILGLGTAAACAFLHPLILRHRKPIAYAAISLIPASLLWLNWSMMEDYRQRILPHSESVAIKTYWDRAARKATQDVYESVGHPGAAPANWWFALRAGVSPAIYDTVSGFEVFSTGPTHPFSFTDPRFAFGGFGPPDETTSPAGRWILEEEALWGFTLRRPRSVLIELSFLVQGQDATVTIEKTGRQLAQATVSSENGIMRFEAPRSAMNAGINIFTIKVTPHEGSRIGLATGVLHAGP